MVLLYAIWNEIQITEQTKNCVVILLTFAARFWSRRSISGFSFTTNFVPCVRQVVIQELNGTNYLFFRAINCWIKHLCHQFSPFCWLGKQSGRRIWACDALCMLLTIWKILPNKRQPNSSIESNTMRFCGSTAGKLWN